MLLRLSPLVLTVLLTACQSLPTPPQEPERFDLGLTTWAERPAALPPAVVLADIQAPWQAEGSTTAMHYRLAYAQPHHRHAYSQAHWSLPPELLVQERLRQWLSQGQRVVLSAEGGRIPPSVAGQAPPVLLLALEQFEQVFDQPAHSSANIRLRATLMGYQAAGEVLLGQQLFTATLPAPSANAAGGAAALSQATDAVASRVLVQSTKAMRRSTVHRPAWLDALLNRRMLICILTGFSSGLPLYLLLNLVPAWLKTEGLNLKLIGAFALIQFPYTWKFLWSPLLDRFSLPGFGRRRGWMLLTQVGLLLAIGFLGGLNPKENIWPILWLATLLSLLSATQDIAVDAFRREILSDHELGLGNAVHVNAYRIAGLVPGSISLILADHLAWSQVFMITALFMLPGVVMVPPASVRSAEPVPKT